MHFVKYLKKVSLVEEGLFRVHNSKCTYIQRGDPKGIYLKLCLLSIVETVDK